MVDKLRDTGASGRFKQGTVIASGDYKSADPTAITIDTHNAKCLRLSTNVTDISGSGATVTVLVQAELPDGTTYATLLSKAITASGVTVQLVGPSIVAASGIAANAPLPKRVKVTCTGSGTRTTLTYSVQAEVS